MVIRPDLTPDYVGHVVYVHSFSDGTSGAASALIALGIDVQAPPEKAGFEEFYVTAGAAPLHYSAVVTMASTALASGLFVNLGVASVKGSPNVTAIWLEDQCHAPNGTHQ